MFYVIYWSPVQGGRGWGGETLEQTPKRSRSVTSSDSHRTTHLVTN